MSIFTSSPYSLDEGDLIVAVVQALNSIGYSTASPENTAGAVVQVVPHAPSSAPTRVSTTSETEIHISISTVTSTGGSPITSYSIEMDDGTGSGFVSV